MEAVWELRTLLITQCMKSEDKWMTIWGLRNKRSKSGRIYGDFRNAKNPQTWSYDFQSLSKINPGVLDTLCVNICMCIYIYYIYIHTYTFMHRYVFPHLKGE